MPGFHLHTGNRLEALAKAMALLLRQPPAAPFTPETVVVQSRGMARWLSLSLADSLGVCANVRFPFPNHLVQELFTEIRSGTPEQTVYEKEWAAFRIMELLPGLCKSDPGFTGIRRYLSDDTQGLKSYQLAIRLADLFDQYALFRPDWIEKWEHGRPAAPGDEWQARLFGEVTKNGVLHRASMRNIFIQHLGMGPFRPRHIPERLFLFGISSLPPFHLELFQLLSRSLDVHLFILNPCSGYWFDKVTERTLSLIDLNAGLSAEQSHFETSHPLLDACGQQGKEFFSLLFSLDPDHTDHSTATGGTGLLQLLQNDILEMKPADSALQSISADDTSLQVHACHSPMREVEVLYDYLLSCFVRHPGLEPRDILVMAPDIETYAPLVDAVFGTVQDERRRIPYSVADKSVKSDRPAVSAFLSLFNAASSRLSASYVLSLLECLAVREKQGLSESDMPRIRDWAMRTRTAWGIDEAHRASLGLPCVRENSWRTGLDRMMLGYAMHDNGTNTVNGIAPFGDIEGKGASALGGLAEFLDALFEFALTLEAPRPLAEWCRVLRNALDRLFSNAGAYEEDTGFIQRALASIQESAQRAGLTQSLGAEAVREHLESAFREGQVHQGFLSQGVTFCSLLPMRSVPFKIIAMLGMNLQDYPRENPRLGFDLMARPGQRRRNDRSRRMDDRYIFLETILSARNELYISHVGRSVQDNAPCLPSVLVSELLEHVDRAFRLQSGLAPREALTVRHRLHGFHPDYFSNVDTRRVSYSAENHAALCRFLEPAQTVPRFTNAPLPVPDDSFRQVTIEDLSRFFCNPSRFLFERRLSLHLDDETEASQDSEPFTLNSLHRFLFIRDSLTGPVRASSSPSLLRSGDLPHAEAGRAQLALLEDEAAQFRQRFLSLAPGALLPPVNISIAIDGFQLNGSLSHCFERAAFMMHPAGDRAIRRLTLWISHLALCAADIPGMPSESCLLLRDAGYRMKKPVDSRALLTDLLRLYWKGLHTPLPFFPEASLAYIGQLRKTPADVAAARKKADAAWLPGNEKYSFGKESVDSYFGLAFRGRDPLAESEFSETARAVYGPILDNTEAF
ncbi:MAG: exodeoxyribonuclease V subunit gamma [Fibrobacterota bacterium]